jgi:hypothetical protein
MPRAVAAVCDSEDEVFGIVLLRSLANDSPSCAMSFSGRASRSDVVHLYTSKGSNGMRAHLTPCTAPRLGHRPHSSRHQQLTGDILGQLADRSSCTEVNAESHAHGARVPGQQYMKSLVGWCQRRGRAVSQIAGKRRRATACHRGGVLATSDDAKDRHG